MKAHRAPKHSTLHCGLNDAVFFIPEEGEQRADSDFTGIPIQKLNGDGLAQGATKRAWD